MLLTLRLNLDAGPPRTATATQTLAAVTQTTAATVTENVTSSEALAPVTQTLLVSEVVGLQALQTLGAVSQGASIKPQVAAAASQPLSAVSQAATIGDTLSVTAIQALPSVAQSASVAVEAVIQAGQTLAPASQTAAISALRAGEAALSALQSLPAVAQAASVATPLNVAGDETLPAINQAVTVETVPIAANLAADQLLAPVSQTAALGGTEIVVEETVRKRFSLRDNYIPEQARKPLRPPQQVRTPKKVREAFDAFDIPLPPADRQEEPETFPEINLGAVQVLSAMRSRAEIDTNWNDDDEEVTAAFMAFLMTQQARTGAAVRG